MDGKLQAIHAVWIPASSGNPCRSRLYRNDVYEVAQVNSCTLLNINFLMKLTSSALAVAVGLCLFSASPNADEIDKIKLPDMGDSSGTLLTPQEEKELGEAFFRSLHTQVNINQDAEIQTYIQTIGDKLAAASDAPGYPFHFFVVMDNDINAFAGPGGYIGINSGLILNTEVESELASVLAHEIAHVTQRHLYRAAEAAGRLTIPTMAATLAAILLGTQSPALGQAAVMAIQAGSVQFQIDFTREHEAEADRVGMQTLASSEFDPRSMPTFFERLQQATRFYGQGVPEFLRTHPVTTSRISDTRGRAETYPYKQYPDSLNYQLTKAKLLATSPTSHEHALKYLKAKQFQGTEEQRVVTRYALGLLALNQQDYHGAEKSFRELTQAYPNQPQFAAALARTALASGDYKTALDIYGQLVNHHPENQVIKLEYVSSLLKAGKAESAKETLATLTEKTQALPIYWELMAQVSSTLQRPAESHRYLAEYYYATGQLKEAILQIRLAQQSQGLNFQLSSILSQRLRFLLEQEYEARRQR